MTLLEKITDENFEALMKYPNVLNVNIGTKWTNKKDTGKPCIVLYVSKKKDKDILMADELIPEKVEGIKTDVVELSTTDFELGETSVSKLIPSVQRRISSGVIID